MTQAKTPDFLNLLRQRATQSSSSIKGSGSGVADTVPAMIQDRQGKPVAPALLSEGEFVIKADIVSRLGGGATDPGVEFLDQFQELVGQMDAESAANFAQAVLIQAEVALEDQPKIENA